MEMETTTSEEGGEVIFEQQEEINMEQDGILITGDISVDGSSDLGGHQDVDENSIIFSESQLQESLCAVGQQEEHGGGDGDVSTIHDQQQQQHREVLVFHSSESEAASTNTSMVEVSTSRDDHLGTASDGSIVVAVLQEVTEGGGSEVLVKIDNDGLEQGQQLEAEEGHLEGTLGEVIEGVPESGTGFEESTDHNGMGGIIGPEQSKDTEEPSAESNCRPETPCNCLSCQEEGAGDGQTDIGDHHGTERSLKLKCLICYTLIVNTPISFPSSSGDDNFGKTVEQHIEDILNVEQANLENATTTATTAQIGQEIVNETCEETKIKEGMSPGTNIPVDSTEEITAEATNKIQPDNIKLPQTKGMEIGRQQEDSLIKLPIVFQILGCTIDDVDKEIESSGGGGGILDQVPLCLACQSVVSEAVLVFRELQRLEKSLGILRESMKDQIVKSYEANYCTKRNKMEIEDAMTIQGQVDIVRRAIISEGISAAKILNSFKTSKRGKRRKTVVSKLSALYPQVSLGIEKKPRNNTKKARFVDESGVRKDDADVDYHPQFEDEFVLGPSAGDQDEKEETTFLQTHSGRRVKKPNYRKWLLADEEDEEIDIKPQPELDAPVSPKSEPEWSPGHSDDEEAEFDSDTDTSGDSEIDSEEDRKDLDELGKLLDQGERFDDIETGKRVVRARRKKKQNSTNPNRIKCTECPKTFADEAKKEIHFRRKHTPGGQVFQCEKCSKIFRRPGLLRKHLQKQHGEPSEAEQGEEGDKKRHMCDFCGQKYRNASELRIHVRLHTGETPYKCEHCDKSFVSSLKREFHVEQSHWEIPPLKCDFCPKAFFRQHRLRIHRISHTGEKAYLCEICSQSFSHPTYLKYHQGQHAELNLETFKCKDCGKTFANPTNLRLHVKTVHLKQFRFTCEVCSMGFTHMSHKRIHMRGHTGERPYKCDLCNESFRYRDRLRIHMRGHTGERPFVCEICKKGFASKSKLKRHEKIHEKNQPTRNPTNEEIEQAIRHRCDDCGKGFAEPQHLSAHRRYCQRKSGEKEEKKPNQRSNQSANNNKTRTVTIAGGPVAKQVEVVTTSTIPQVVTQAGTQQTTMLVPLPVNYAYPVTYTYEVPQYTQQSGVVREYQYQN